MTKKEEFNQNKSIDKHREELNGLIEKMEKEGFSSELLNKINNKKCKISILQKQLDSSKLKQNQYTR